MSALLGLAACGPSEPTLDPIATAQTSGTTALLQAVSVVNVDTVWVSGHDGTYARTTDGGTMWMDPEADARMREWRGRTGAKVGYRYAEAVKVFSFG